MRNGNRQLPAILVTCGVALLFAAPARANDASPWAKDMNSALRLIAGGKNDDAQSLHAGVEIRLDAGWHTYWRYPGDSGVPPRFDFSGSDNVADVQVLYPAPQAITDETGTIIGYKDDVIFPLRVVPRQKDKPVTLHAKIDYAICAKLCVPVEARVQLTLAGGTANENSPLIAAEARVPQPVSAAQAGLSVRRANEERRKPLVFVDLAAPGGQPVEIFVEGPTADWALPIPKPAPGAPPGRRQFAFELDGLPSGADPKASVDLTFTIVSGGHASEVKTHLD